MIADGVGRIIDAPRRLLAHRQAAVQHPVDGGNADARGLGKIGNGRPSGHRSLLR